MYLKQDPDPSFFLTGSGTKLFLKPDPDPIFLAEFGSAELVLTGGVSYRIRVLIDDMSRIRKNIKAFILLADRSILTHNTVLKS